MHITELCLCRLGIGWASIKKHLIRESRPEGTLGECPGLTDLISSLIFQPNKHLGSHLPTILLRSEDACNISVLLAESKHHSTVYPAFIHLQFMPVLPPPGKQTTVRGNTEILTESSGAEGRYHYYLSV